MPTNAAKPNVTSRTTLVLPRGRSTFAICRVPGCEAGVRPGNPCQPPTWSPHGRKRSPSGHLFLAHASTGLAREKGAPPGAPPPRACQHWVCTREKRAPPGAPLPRACPSPPSLLSRLAAEPLATCLRRHQGSVRLVTPTERRAAFSLKPPS